MADNLFARQARSQRPKSSAMERIANCLAKLEWMNKSLRHEEPDRVPVSGLFLGPFLRALAFFIC
jgi:hypothetical protein